MNHASSGMNRGALAQLSKQHGVESDRDRQRHRVARDRQARRELIKKHAGSEAVEDRGERSGRIGVFGVGNGAKEFPELDVTLRGAVSIARRLQDPLAELVKIEPKAIGVGQYQHDVNQVKLARALDARVEDCVNAVGVDVNTASAALLSRVAGLSQRGRKRREASRCQRPVRQSQGAAESAAAGRQGVRAMRRLPARVRRRQSAGCQRRASGSVSGGRADHRAVRPRGEKHHRRRRASCAPEAEQFTDERFGVPTVRDILKELEKPGRDPRPEFVAPSFAEGVEDVKDLKPGMILEGRVTNVAAFGAFVDIGVHQDGLVHVSALSHTFVKDPRDAVKAGDIVKVKVMEVDLPRQRIGLEMRLDDEPRPRRLATPTPRSVASSSSATA
jgi:uncharacterized protein